MTSETITGTNTAGLRPAPRRLTKKQDENQRRSEMETTTLKLHPTNERKRTMETTEIQNDPIQSASLLAAQAALPEMEWEQRHDKEGGYSRYGNISASFSQYEPGSYSAGEWYWVVKETDSYVELSGIVATREEALAELTRWIKAGAQEIHKQKVRELLGEIEKTVAEVMAIDPRAVEEMPGFLAGRHAGLQAARQALTGL